MCGRRLHRVLFETELFFRFVAAESCVQIEGKTESKPGDEWVDLARDTGPRRCVCGRKQHRGISENTVLIGRCLTLLTSCKIERQGQLSA